MTLLFTALLLGFLLWIFRQLRSPYVLNVRKEAGLTTASPRSAYVLGLLLAVGLGFAMFVVN